jgi:hypothetical protein
VTLTTQQAPRQRAASSLLGAVAVLALGAWGHPAFAATDSDARCDQPADALPMSIAADGKLAIGIIEHSSAGAATDDDISLEDAVADAAADTANRPTGPRVDIMLRRIFDDAIARQPSLPKPEVTGDLSGPLAVDQAEKAEEQATTVLEAEPADSSAEFPGFSTGELLHYRQQMFRTDI